MIDDDPGKGESRDERDERMTREGQEEAGEVRAALPYGYTSVEEMIASAEAEEIYWDDALTPNGADAAARRHWLDYLYDDGIRDADEALKVRERIEDAARTLLIELLKLDKYREIPMTNLAFRAYAVAIVWEFG